MSNNNIIQREITLNIGESYLNVTNWNDKNQMVTNMQVVHNILNNDYDGLSKASVKEEMLIAA